MTLAEKSRPVGPAKGKDFATSIGPYLVTLDELEDKMIGDKTDMLYNLDIKGYCKIEG